MGRNFFIIGLILLAPLVVFGQQTDQVDDYVIEEGPVVGFEGDPPMHTQEEIDKINRELEETGYFAESDNEQEKGVDCFDYYTFQSVQPSFSKNKDLFKPGETVKFSGTIENKNSYSVVDGNLFVRISHRNINYLKEGNYVIDEIIALENVVIKANSATEGSFEWKIPENAQAGEYVFDYFFSVGKKFNLGGLPFSNEVIIGNLTLKVITPNNDVVSFERTATKVNNIPYKHIGNWPRIEGGDRVEVFQPIVNTFDKSKELNVTYDLYFWDSLDSDDLISSKKEKVVVSANSRKDLMYVIPEMNESVYYLKITAESKDGQKSIVNIRLVSNQPHPRLNYPAITKFPLDKNDKFTLFSCLHNTSRMSSKGKVSVKIFDKSNNEIDSIEYNGVITSEMDVVAKDVVAEKKYDYIKLVAEIRDEKNNVVDSYETVYDCEQLNDCSGAFAKSKISAKTILFVLFLLIPVAVAIVLFLRKKNY